jgi:hypothetical protein
MPADPDHLRELLLVDLIDNCRLCTANFPVVCTVHRIMAQRLAIQRRDSQGAYS